MNQKRILVLGDAMLDVVVRALEPVNITSDTASSVRLGREARARTSRSSWRSIITWLSWGQLVTTPPARCS